MLRIRSFKPVLIELLLAVAVVHILKIPNKIVNSCQLDPLILNNIIYIKSTHTKIVWRVNSEPLIPFYRRLVSLFKTLINSQTLRSDIPVSITVIVNTLKRNTESLQVPYAL